MRFTILIISITILSIIMVPTYFYPEYKAFYIGFTELIGSLAIGFLIPLLVNLVYEKLFKVN